jgi:hypothetical protein
MAFPQEAWDRIQTDARNGKWGDFSDLRRALCDRHAEQHPDDGIGTSDVNHMIFGMLHGNEDMTPADALYEARHG